MIKKLSKKIGFSETEIKVLLFIFCILLIGYTYRFYKSDENNVVSKFDYSTDDSIFLASKDTLAENTDELIDGTIENLTDIKKESKRNKSSLSNKKDESKNISAKKIDLNSATKEQLKIVPGIGDRIAENILELKKKLGRFNNFEQLFEVKGIGKSKLEKIKSIFFIE